MGLKLEHALNEIAALKKQLLLLNGRLEAVLAAHHELEYAISSMKAVVFRTRFVKEDELEVLQEAYFRCRPVLKEGVGNWTQPVVIIVV